MAYSKDIQAVNMQLAIQACMAVVKAMRKVADPPIEPHTRRISIEEPHRPRQD